MSSNYRPPQRRTPAIMVIADPEQVEHATDEFAARYARDYDIRSATSAEQAERLTRELVADGEPIAMFAVTMDLPDSSFDDLVPELRRMSPTTRAVCIVAGKWASPYLDRLREAVSDGVIDAYLVIPRGPRDEEFHTAIAEMLSEWGWTSAAPEAEALQLVAREASPELLRLKDIASRMGVPFGKYPADSEVGQQIIAQAGDDARLPLVRTMTGEILQDPSLADLGEALSASVSELPEDFVADLLIVGAGPAGLASAVYGASEGLQTVVLESEATGGQAGTSSMIRNYLGFPRGISGMRLAQRARFQANRFGAKFFIGRPAERLIPGDPHTVVLEGGATVRARAVVVSTGAEYRRLGIDSVEQYVGRGVFYGAAMSLAQLMRGQRVYIVGGGNSAGQAAVHLSRFAAQVTMLVRRRDLSETMSEYLIREVTANSRIEVRGNTEVVDAGGEDRLSWLLLRDAATGREQRVRAGALMLLLGADACTTWLPQQIALDERDFVTTGRDVPQPLWSGELPPQSLGTSVPGVFAVGDVRSGSMKRVASASGEGASVVPLVHAYLEECATQRSAEPV
ncbi:FAD-dependent oxidoreductase [Epidermidibacterium keratini]|uniref:FAD-dependent oxidoreductase n=1 Tax=Epidermidibacterium keratini TaxID=1891644 RepID=A0A7L4YTV3_9ACTN|nr:FAD-dependent oxidoreductase [Epidermidibacterium keratini]QHC01937.1 FAD-dependent oxidoreductase [Epidermidibacterium keratini]